MKYTRAETLIETMIAISILMIILAPAQALYVTSIQNTAINRNYLAAEMLAQEGVEAVNKMRNTNLLKFSANTKECWNAKPEHSDISSCALQENKIAGESLTSLTQKRFRLTRNIDTLEFKFSEVFDANLSDPYNSTQAAGDTSQYRLRQDIATETNPECRTQGNPQNCDFHTSLYFSPADGSMQNERGQESRFYREIMIQYLDLDNNNTAPFMRVYSHVQYNVGNMTKNVKRSLLISNKAQ